MVADVSSALLERVLTSIATQLELVHYTMTHPPDHPLGDARERFCSWSSYVFIFFVGSFVIHATYIAFFGPSFVFGLSEQVLRDAWLASSWSKGPGLELPVGNETNVSVQFQP
jgi:hypothetical protein